MDEQDAVTVSHLIIGRGHNQPEVQARNQEKQREDGKNGRPP